MDSYALCPCGSGKKVKFCCQKLLPEMEKIERLQDNQPEQALAHLDRLEQASPGNPWVVTTRAGTLMQQGEFAEAKLTLLKFLKEHSDHPRANALYAFAAFHADGYPASKKAVHRAFKRCVEESPRIVSALMEALGEHHQLQGHALAARAHLMLALRFSPVEEDRERIIRGIMQFDAEPATPFLLRGGLSVPMYEPAEASRETFDKARHLSLLACWEEAANLIEQLSEQDPESADLWRTLGLFRAWDGDEAAAAAALHRAAALYKEGTEALDCETLAQLLDQGQSDRLIPIRVRRFKATSVSQLLSRLDEEPRFARGDDGVDTPRGQGEPSAMYLILDRPLPPKEELAQLTEDNVPVYVGRVLVFDGVPDDDLPAVAFLSGLEGEQLDAAETAFLSAAGNLVQTVEPPPQEDAEAVSAMETLGHIPADELPLHRNYYIPPGTPAPLRTAIQDAHWRRIVEELWPSSPQAALGGKTPLEAAGDPSLRVALEAALQVFQAFSDMRQHLAPTTALRQRLQLGEAPTRKLDSALPAGGLSNADLERLDLPSLGRDELKELIARLRMSSHPRLLYSALKEWANRGTSVTESSEEDTDLNPEAAYALLAMLAAQFGEPQAALGWVERGRQLPAPAESRFETQLGWKLRELRVRTQYFGADELRPLLLDLWENYSSKLPELREQLTQVVIALGIDPPWEGVIVASGETWSPSAVAESGPKTLWLPGQG